MAKGITALLQYPGSTKPIEDRVTLVFDWPHSRRDPDNQSFGAKMILDGLVKAGVLPDDSRKWIAEIKHVFRRDNKIDQMVIVEIASDKHTDRSTDEGRSEPEA